MMAKHTVFSICFTCKVMRLMRHQGQRCETAVFNVSGQHGYWLIGGPLCQIDINGLFGLFFRLAGFSVHNMHFVILKTMHLVLVQEFAFLCWDIRY